MVIPHNKKALVLVVYISVTTRYVRMKNWWPCLMISMTISVRRLSGRYHRSSNHEKARKRRSLNNGDRFGEHLETIYAHVCVSDLERHKVT